MDAKIASYNQHKNTLLIVSEFEDALSELTVVEFAALLCHSGYIPDKYSADSTEETLYTKLIEALVKRWAVLVGFDKTTLPTQKSSKEDVTITDGQSVIVCDTKSFRLGRSQKAPNVKDVLKHSDIAKWLDNHEDTVQAGGLVVLPSQHDWVRGSDFYQYTTDKSLPTLCLNYEHLSFILLSGLRKESLLEILRGYGDIFPSKLPKGASNRNLYYTAIEKSLFGELIDDWSTFKIDASAIVSEFVYHTENKIEQEISKIAADIRGKCSEIKDVETLINMIVDLQTEVKTSRLQASSENIRKFRSGSGCYNEGYR